MKITIAAVLSIVFSSLIFLVDYIADENVITDLTQVTEEILKI